MRGSVCQVTDKWSRQRGSALLELSLILPLLALMAVGVTNFGLVLGEKQVIVEAARYGARRAAAEGQAICTSSEREEYIRCSDILVDRDTDSFAGIEPTRDTESSAMLGAYYACHSVAQSGLRPEDWQVRTESEEEDIAPTISVQIERANPANFFVSLLMGATFPTSRGTFVNQRPCDSDDSPAGGSAPL